jgi:hypothetical protein
MLHNQAQLLYRVRMLSCLGKNLEDYTLTKQDLLILELHLATMTHEKKHLLTAQASCRAYFEHGESYLV